MEVDFSGRVTSAAEIIARVMGVARELDLEVEPGGGTGLMQPHGKALAVEEVLLGNAQRA